MTCMVYQNYTNCSPNDQIYDDECDYDGNRGERKFTDVRHRCMVLRSFL